MYEWVSRKEYFIQINLFYTFYTLLYFSLRYTDYFILYADYFIQISLYW